MGAVNLDPEDSVLPCKAGWEDMKNKCNNADDLTITISLVYSVMKTMKSAIWIMGIANRVPGIAYQENILILLNNNKGLLIYIHHEKHARTKKRGGKFCKPGSKAGKNLPHWITPRWISSSGLRPRLVPVPGRSTPPPAGGNFVFHRILKSVLPIHHRGAGPCSLHRPGCRYLSRF